METADSESPRFWLFNFTNGSEIWRRDASVASTWDVIGWWEIRRLAFNLAVGCAGILSCLMVLIVSIAASTLYDSDFGMPDPPIFAVFGVFFYAFIANVCYTSGWLAELVVRAVWPTQSRRFARVSFRIGMIFSVILTLVPGILISALGFFLFLRRVTHSFHF
jgi:hypothetical protein